MPKFESFDDMHEYNYRIQKKYDLRSVFSVGDSVGEGYDQPSLRSRATDLNGVPLPDKVYIVADAEWTDGQPFKKLVKKPTWLALWKLTDEQMNTTKDYHHVFLEGVYSSQYTIGDIPVYSLCLGS